MLGPCTYQALVLPLLYQGVSQCCFHALAFCGSLRCVLLQLGYLKPECFQAHLRCLSRRELHLGRAHLHC